MTKQSLSCIHLKPQRRFIHGVDNSIDLQVDVVDGVKRQCFDVDVISKYLFCKSCSRNDTFVGHGRIKIQAPPHDPGIVTGNHIVI